MTETITYAFTIILLPIIPSLILYLAIPAQESEVEGEYQGLSIKLKGAFGSYFVLVLMLSTFIFTMIKTNPPYEYWTVDGSIDLTDIQDPQKIVISIQPPDQQIYADGRFHIKNAPIVKGDVQHSALVLQYVEGNVTKQAVLHLEKEQMFQTEDDQELNFEKDHVTIRKPIVLKDTGDSNPENTRAGRYDPSNAQPVEMLDGGVN